MRGGRGLWAGLSGAGAFPMSLLPIVRALGGTLYDRGTRATIPGPGHSTHDRSVSLLLSRGRLIVHSFGRSRWRDVLDALRAQGLVDAQGQLGSGAGEEWSQVPAPSAAVRAAIARRLWSEAAPLARQLSMVHVRRRGSNAPRP